MTGKQWKWIKNRITVSCFYTGIWFRTGVLGFHPSPPFSFFIHSHFLINHRFLFSIAPFSSTPFSFSSLFFPLYIFPCFLNLSFFHVLIVPLFLLIHPLPFSYPFFSLFSPALFFIYFFLFLLFLGCRLLKVCTAL